MKKKIVGVSVLGIRYQVSGMGYQVAELLVAINIYLKIEAVTTNTLLSDIRYLMPDT